MPDNFKYVQAQSTQLYGAGASIGDTSVRIASLIDLLGSNLAMTDFGSKGYGTLEPGTSSQEEPISWTGVTQNGDGTATLTGVSNVLGKAPYTEVSGLKITHAGGTTFVISNTAAFYNSLTSKSDDETIAGIYTFTSPNYPQMDTAVVAPSADAQLATKKYVDDTTSAGAPKATNSVYGISKLSTAAVSGTQPIVVGDNDTRVPTQNENDALVGTSGTAVSSSNKLVDNTDTDSAKTANKIARRDASGNVLVTTTPTTGDAAASKTYADTLKYLGFVAISDTAHTIAAANNTQTTSSTSYVKVKQFTVQAAGSYYISYTISLGSAGGGTGSPVNNIEFYKNGVDASIGDSFTYSGAGQAHLGQTISGVNIGDTLEIWMKNTQPGTNAAASQITASAIDAVLLPVVTININ